MKNKEKTIFWIFLLISITAVIINSTYAIFNEPYPIPSYIKTMVIISNFTDSVVALYFGTLILGISSSFYKCITVGVLGFLMMLLIDFAGLSLILVSVGTILLIVLFIFIMRLFNIGVLKTIGLMIIQAIIMILINVAVALLQLLFLQIT